MKHLWILFTALTFILPLQAQHKIVPLGDKASAAAFADEPQKFMSDIKVLKGFGILMEVDPTAKGYDKLTNYYERGKDGENFLVFFIKTELVNSKGKVVGSSNQVKAKLIPGQKLFPGTIFDVSFPGSVFAKLPQGSYEMRWKAMPANKELSSMFSMANPEIRYKFSK